jgi:hypothetical protein
MVNFFFKMVNLNEIFYVMKVIGKIHSGIFLVGRIVNFHFRTNLEFSAFAVLELLHGPTNEKKLKAYEP